MVTVVLLYTRPSLLPTAAVVSVAILGLPFAVLGKFEDEESFV